MKTSQINVRFTPQIDADLTAICKKMGVTRSAMVRKLTEVFISEVKRTGSLTLNHQWIKALGDADARSPWGDRKLKGDQSKKADSPPLAKVAEDDRAYGVKPQKMIKP